jgi:hypothetical protein
MTSLVAQRLWAAARLTGGVITPDDVSESDIAHGRADGWLTSASIGHFEATDKLRQDAGLVVGALPQE